MKEFYQNYPQNTRGSAQDPPVFLSAEQILPLNTTKNIKNEQNIIIRLANSIKKYGILEPLAVKPASNQGGFPVYELIDGERRYRAASIAGVEKIPCVVLSVSAPKCLQIAEITRLKQEKLHFFALAEAFLRLLNEYHMTQEEIARRMGLSQSAVANKLRLLKFTPEERRLIITSGLTERHARAILRLTAPLQRAEAITTVQRDRLNVAQTEALVARYAPKSAENPRETDSVASNTAEKYAFAGQGDRLSPQTAANSVQNTAFSPQNDRLGDENDSFFQQSDAPAAQKGTFLPPQTPKNRAFGDLLGQPGAQADSGENRVSDAAKSASGTPASAVKPRKFALRDLKPLYNSIERTLSIFQKTGVAAEYRKEEDENAARIVIYIPKRG